MDKTKEIIHTNSDNIKTQLSVLIDLLQKVAEVGTNNISIDNSSTEDMIHSTSHIQHVNSVQCAILEKFNSIIIGLESLYKQNMDSLNESNSLHTDVYTTAEHETNHLVVEPLKQSNPNDSCTKEDVPTSCKQSTNVSDDNKTSDNRAVKSCMITDKIKSSQLWSNEVEKVANVVEKSAVYFEPSGKHTSVESNAAPRISKRSNFEKVSSVYVCNELREKPVPQCNSRCLISHMESPSELYIQMIDEENVHIDLINDIIGEMYNNKPFENTTKKQTKRKFGRYCTANYQNWWYRVEVLEWFLEEETDNIMIHLIDYGNKCSISYQALRPMSEQISYFPKLAQLCHLPYMCPPGANITGNLDWPRESIDGFLELLDSDAPYVVTYAKMEGNSIGIDLIKDGDNVSIGELLINSGFAEIPKAAEIVQDCMTIKNEVMRRQILDAQRIPLVPDMTEDEKIQKYFDTLNIEEGGENINEAVANYDPKDEVRICKFARNGSCFKKHCELEHVQITKDFTTDKIVTYRKAIYDLVLPGYDEEIIVRIMYANSVCKFYVQIISSSNILDYSSFEDLQDVLNRPQTIKSYKPFKLLPALGEIVLVKSWDEQWYRAQVRDVLPLANNDADIQVFIVDCGEIIDVKLKDVRQITENLLYVPFQAVECRLFNAIESSEVNPVDAKNIFEELYLCKNYRAKVIANVGYLELLVDDEDGNDIGDSLIRRGLALPRTEHVFPTKLLLVD